MKLKNLLLMVACFMATGLSAQVAIGGGEPAEGSILDLSGATNLGLLLPRVTALPTANNDLNKAGMMVYNTTDKKVYTYDASVPAWVAGAIQADLSGSVTAAALKKINGNTLWDGPGNIVIADGAQGPAGPQGDPGTPGANGDKGDTGAVGPQGPEWSGTTATTGADGLMSAADKLKLDQLSNVLTNYTTATNLSVVNTEYLRSEAVANCAAKGPGWRLATIGEVSTASLTGRPTSITLTVGKEYALLDKSDVALREWVAIKESSSGPTNIVQGLVVTYRRSICAK
jgi:hypothetical protein